MGRPYAEVIGDPIGHSLSPTIHGFWLSKLEFDADYRATHVTPNGLASYFDARREDPEWRGCNITIPHKVAATALVDDLQDGGIGAINCVFPRQGRLIGCNTDAGGFDSSLPEPLGHGDRVVLIGGGGAAAAAVAALAARGVQIDIVVRRPDQGLRLLALFGAKGTSLDFLQAGKALRDCSGAVNASPLGMNGFPAMPDEVIEGLPAIRRLGFVLDMVYAPLRTAFLEAGEGAGLHAVDGLAMLVGQAGLAFRHFFGKQAPREYDEELRRVLTR